MTVPLSRSVALVVQLGPPNRPAQPLVHGDSPSGGDQAAVDSSPGTRHSVRWGCRPADGLRERRPLLVPGTREADVRRLLQAMRELTGMKPGRGVLVPSSTPERRSGCCRCPGTSARHLRQRLLGSGIHCAANARSMQTATRLAAKAVPSTDDHRSPLSFVCGHQACKYVT